MAWIEFKQTDGIEIALNTSHITSAHQVAENETFVGGHGEQGTTVKGTLKEIIRKIRLAEAVQEPLQVEISTAEAINVISSGPSDV